MTIDPTTTDEGSVTKRRVATGVVAAMLVAAAGGIGFGIGRAVDDDQVATDDIGQETTTTVEDAAGPTDVAADETDPVDDDAALDEGASDEAAESPAAEPTQSEPAEAPAIAVDEAPPLGDDAAASSYYVPGPLETVYERTIDGVRYRAQRGEPYPDEGDFYEVDGWQPAEFCWPRADGRVTLDGPDVVDVVGMGWYTAIYGDVVASPGVAGFSDDVPQTVVLVQTVPDATTARVEWPTGVSDETPVEGGVAVLVLPGVTDPWLEPDVLVEVDTPGGVVTVPLAGAFDVDEEFRDACSPPPPELPEPGEQPADPAAATAAVEDRFATLWDLGVDREDKADLLDDWTGVQDAIDEALEGSFGEDAAAAVHVIEELVFTSPTDAWFRYRVETSVSTFTERYGTATLVDSGWQFPRALICQDLSLAGASCEPWVESIYPPSWYDRYGAPEECWVDEDGVEVCEVVEPLG